MSDLLKINRNGPSEIRVCPLCFAAYRSKIPTSSCPICDDSESFANGFLAGWFDCQEKLKKEKDMECL